MRDRRRAGTYLLLGFFIVGLFTGCAAQIEGKGKASQDAIQQREQVKSAERDIFAMDTYMTITAYGEQAEEAVDAAKREITRLDRMLSAQNPESEVFAVNETGSEVLSEDAAALVEKSMELYESTGGLFDITVYPLMQEWGFITRKYHVPEKKRLRELLRNVGTSKIKYDAAKHLLTLSEGMQIDLGGIAKGYASERIMEIYKEYGIQSGIVSLGGNVQTYGAKTDGSFWNVAIQNPDTSSNENAYIGVLETKDKAVITSGGYERYFEQNGKRYHHILNPDTGYLAESGLSSVTIVSNDGMLADGLSTSLFIMGKEKALEYWREHADSFDVILAGEDGSVVISEGLEESFSSDFDVFVAYQ